MEKTALYSPEMDTPGCNPPPLSPQVTPGSNPPAYNPQVTAGPSPPQYNPQVTVNVPQTNPQPQALFNNQIVMPQQAPTVVMPAAPTVVVQQPTPRPANYLWLSCLVYWFCNPVVGCIAFAMSMASSSAADENRMDEARNCGKASCWTSIIGSVVGVITIIVVIVLIVAAVHRTAEAVSDGFDPYN